MNTLQLLALKSNFPGRVRIFANASDDTYIVADMETQSRTTISRNPNIQQINTMLTNGTQLTHRATFTNDLNLIDKRIEWVEL